MIDLKFLRGGSTTSPTDSAYIGPIGEILVVTDGFSGGSVLLRVQDGVTPGGHPVGAGAGTVTSITAGTGLSGGTITSVGTISLSIPVTVARGGTGLTATPSNGQLLIGNGSGFTEAVLTAGTGISVTNGSGSISIAATGVFGAPGTGISAAGTNQGTATVLTTGMSFVNTSVDGTKGVSIGTVLMSAGTTVWIVNEDGTNNLIVYPPSGGVINNQSANIPMTLFPNSATVLAVKSSTALRSNP